MFRTDPASSARKWNEWDLLRAAKLPFVPEAPLQNSFRFKFDAGTKVEFGCFAQDG
jgi:hypothetical protein